MKDTSQRHWPACLRSKLVSYAAGHTLPMIQMQIADAQQRARAQALLLANLNSVAIEFIARTKILSNHASWYILERLPVIPAEAFAHTKFGQKAAEEIVRDAVLELSYT